LVWATEFAWIAFALAVYAAICGSFRNMGAVVWTLAALAGVALGFYSIHVDDLYAKHGVPAEAQVSNRVHHVVKHYVNFVYQDTTDEYSLDYSFTVGGRLYGSHNVYVSKKLWDDTESHSALHILYLDTSPSMSIIDHPGARSGQHGAAIFIFFMAGAAFIVAIYYWLRRPKAGVARSGYARRQAGTPRPGNLPRRSL
jgi:hypothetical protein